VVVVLLVVELVVVELEVEVLVDDEVEDEVVLEDVVEELELVVELEVEVVLEVVVEEEVVELELLELELVVVEELEVVVDELVVVLVELLVDVEEEVVVKEKFEAVNWESENSAIFLFYAQAYSVTITFNPPAVAPAFVIDRPHIITSSESGSPLIELAGMILATWALYVGTVVAKVLPSRDRHVYVIASAALPRTWSSNHWRPVRLVLVALPPVWLDVNCVQAPGPTRHKPFRTVLATGLP